MNTDKTANESAATERSPEPPQTGRRPVGASTGNLPHAKGRGQADGRPDPARIAALVQASMLGQARARAADYGGRSRFWRRPYAQTDPSTAAAVAPVWITTYPASVITKDGQSVLGALGDADLWQSLSKIGIRAIHCGPTKLSGGLTDGVYTPTIDGNFDRIGFGTDPSFGTQEEFTDLSLMAAAHRAVVIDDTIPSHTGQGPDFELATLRHADYPGLYHMIEIPEEDWALLPDVPAGRSVANLTPAAVDALAEREYLVGHLQRVIFFEPGVKETDWSATRAVTGVDGIRRRWVYLHYFKDGQPSLNWLDPSCAAQQFVMGDILHSLDVLGARGIRFDANGFLGVERRGPGEPAWSESHPLSVTANQMLGGIVRKAGGFSFQELNLTIDDIAALSSGGADLSYDFITRPAYHHALVTGDTAFLRLMLNQVHAYGIDPASLIHALQNHDELTLELVHFWTLHADDMFEMAGDTWQGRTLRTYVREAMYEALSGPRAPYNLRFVTNGISSTTVSVVAAALGYESLEDLSDAQRDEIMRGHLLLVMYNAFQPGVFALSGWDLVGALPLDPAQVADRIADGDTRWIHRGAYDLAGAAPDAEASSEGIPRARALYGSLPEQLADPGSFAVKLRRLLAIREAYSIASCEQIAIPDVQSPGLLVMVHRLADRQGTQITALNFGREPISETITIDDPRTGPVFDLIDEVVVGKFGEDGAVRIDLDPLGGTLLRIVHALPV